MLETHFGKTISTPNSGANEASRTCTEILVMWEDYSYRKYLWSRGSFLSGMHRTSAAEADLQTGYFHLQTQVTC